MDNHFTAQFLLLYQHTFVLQIHHFQFNVTVDHGLLEAREVDIKAALLQQVHDLGDLILHDYQQQLDWPWGSTMSATKSANREEIYRAFQQERHNLIMPLRKFGYLRECFSQ